MAQFDQKLKGALDADDEAFLRRLDEDRGLFAQIGDTMTGPLGGWAKLVLVNSVLVVIVMVGCALMAIGAESDRAAILWSTAALAALFVQGMLKQWLFERMNLFTLLRELKRIELRVVRMEGE
jgi:hypothetical protein